MVEQPVGAFIDLVLQPAHGVDRVIDRRADEPFGAVPPQAELDALAVDQDQAAIGGQRAVGDDQLQGDGLAAAGFPADEHVALGEGDVDLVAHFVGAQVHGLPDRQRHGAGQGAVRGHHWFSFRCVVTAGRGRPPDSSVSGGVP